MAPAPSGVWLPVIALFCGAGFDKAFLFEEHTNSPVISDIPFQVLAADDCDPNGSEPSRNRILPSFISPQRRHGPAPLFRFYPKSDLLNSCPPGWKEPEARMIEPESVKRAHRRIADIWKKTVSGPVLRLHLPVLRMSDSVTGSDTAWPAWRKPNPLRMMLSKDRLPPIPAHLIPEVRPTESPSDIRR